MLQLGGCSIREVIHLSFLEHSASQPDNLFPFIVA